MGKLKTKQTLRKRIKKTKKGKFLRGQIDAGHLKRKWTSNKKKRKSGNVEQENKGHIEKFKRLLGKHA